MTAPVALVTGSTSGIGEGIARYFAEKGMRVVVNSRTSAAAGEALAGALPEATYLQGDVADPDQATRLIERSVERYGRLDVLVNNAGISRVVEHTDLAGASPALWRELLDVNLIGPWVLTTAAVPYLEASPNGAIINITSHAGVRPKGASIPYAASKAALNHVHAAARGGTGAQGARQRDRPRPRGHPAHCRVDRGSGTLEDGGADAPSGDSE